MEVIGEGVFEHVFKGCAPGLVTPGEECVAVKTLKSNVEHDLLEDFDI